MHTRDLFDNPLPAPSRKQAQDGANEGMTRAVDHADRVIGGWSDMAYEYLRQFKDSHKEFLTEDVRIWAETQGLEPPPDNRAWGAVINRAVRANLIRRVGYGNAKTGHMRPMPVWSKI